MAVASIVTLGVVAYQSIVLSQTLGEMREQTKSLTKSVQVAQGQLDEAIKNRETSEKTAADSNALALRSLEASVDMARNDQRAWLGHTRYVDGTIQAGEPFRIPVEIVNSGKTPGLDVRMLTATYRVQEGGPPPPMIFPRRASGPTTIPPGSSIFGNAEISAGITEAELALMRSGARTLYIYGVVCYSDVFGEAHWMTHCGKYVPSRKSFDACEMGNDTDREGHREHPACRTD